MSGYQIVSEVVGGGGLIRALWQNTPESVKQNIKPVAKKVAKMAVRKYVKREKKKMGDR
jgi:hypothetical protein